MSEFGELPKFSRPPTESEKFHYLSSAGVYNRDTRLVDITGKVTAENRFDLAVVPSDQLFAEFIAGNSGGVTVIKNLEAQRLERVRERA